MLWFEACLALPSHDRNGDGKEAADSEAALTVVAVTNWPLCKCRRSDMRAMVWGTYDGLGHCKLQTQKLH